jgi:glycosyltransferase involved in cell wall biosynthesis
VSSDRNIPRAAADPAGLRLAWQVLRAEGLAAVRDRSLDRLAAWRRRRRFRDAGEVLPADLSRRPEPSPAASPPVLNVLPTAPRPDLGGVQTQLLRRLEAEAASRPWALLYPEAGGWRLERRDGPRREAVTYRVPVSLAPERLADETFAAVVRDAAVRVGARGVHVEQPVGLPLASLASLRRSGLAVVLSVHDFGLFCLRPHLLERPQMRFCDYCREAARCARCLARDWRLEDGFQERRREIAAALLRSAEAVVYPSDFLRRTYAELVPGLDPARQRIVEPPSVARPVAAPAIAPRRRVRHLAYVGSVQPHKGALVLEELVGALPPDRYPDLRWTVYGGGDRDILRRLRRLPALRVRGYYRAGELPRLLRDHRVDLALLLSIVPESYSLTLDECRLAGVPVLTFDRGATAERVRSSSGGVVSPNDDTESMLEKLTTILDDGFAGSSLPAFRPPDAASAAAACLEIYRALNLHGN